MPSVDRQLARDQRGAGVDAVIEDFEQIRSILSRQCREPPVIQHDERGFRGRLEELDVAAIAVRNSEFLDETRHAPVLNRSALPAALLRESAGEPGLAGTGSAGDQEVLRTPEPLAGSESGDLLFIEAAGCFVIDILDASVGDLQARAAQQPRAALIVSIQPFSVDDEGNAFIERERMDRGSLLLLLERLDHAMEL